MLENDNISKRVDAASSRTDVTADEEDLMPMNFIVSVLKEIRMERISQSMKETDLWLKMKSGISYIIMAASTFALLQHDWCRRRRRSDTSSLAFVVEILVPVP